MRTNFLGEKSFRVKNGSTFLFFWVFDFNRPGFSPKKENPMIIQILTLKLEFFVIHYFEKKKLEHLEFFIMFTDNLELTQKKFLFGTNSTINFTKKINQFFFAR